MEKQRKSSLSECTTIVVGGELTGDGSRIYARSEDFDAMRCKNWLVFDETDNGPEEFVANDSAFKCPLPKKRLGYTALPDYQYHHEWGSAGFNTAGVGESSTETIFSSPEALKHDPYVADGLAENCTYNTVLPYIHTAREGVERLGAMIEKYGSAEGFGIGFIDNKETWYLENACGHHWLACRIPNDKYFVTGNQSRFRDYDPDDTDNFLADKDLLSFAEKNGLWNPKDGKFDFHKAYSKDDIADHTYNYTRVWGLQKLFTPSMVQDVNVNDFPVYATPDSGHIGIKELRQAFRFHYDGTDHDPYLHNNGHEPWRPVSIFRTTQTHLLQVRPWLPDAIGHITYVANGMADLGVFLPIYQGIKSFPMAYQIGDNHCSDGSAYWKFRKVMTLAMTNYNVYAPLVKETYAKLEAENDQRQKEFEAKYLAIYKDSPMEAQDMLQHFSDTILIHALEVADKLTLELFTRLTEETMKNYMFHGA